MLEDTSRADVAEDMTNASIVETKTVAAPVAVNIASSTQGAAQQGWKVDVPMMVQALEHARDARAETLRAKGEKTEGDGLMEHYETQLEQLSLQHRLFSIQDGVQKGLDVSQFDEEDAPASRAVIDFGTKASFGLNIFLLGIKLVAAYRSGSVTVLASLIDSILDLMSGAILVVVSLMHERNSAEMFPAGKHLFEPLGTLVFSCAMFVSATKLLQEVADEVADMDRVKFEMDVTTLCILFFVIVSKSIAAYLCFKFGTGSSVLIALAEDHRNDIVANIVALLGFVCAVHITPWIDPVLGLSVTIFILYVWASKIMEQLQLLSGRSAPEEYRNAITVLARNHDPRVLQVDTVRAFTAGTGYTVEVDFVLPEGMALKEAHDIGESFQMFLENTPQLNVSRAYVHLDTETNHDPKRHM